MTKYFIIILFSAFFMIPTPVTAEDTMGATTETVIAKAEKIADEAIAPTITPVETPPAALETPTAPAIPTTFEEIVPTPSPTPDVALDAVAPSLEPTSAPIAEAPSVIAEAIPTDNLEFISGEISVSDEATQSVTVKLYGETESGTSDKTLKVMIDGTTDITDGEQDRDLKSLTAGTEVDVEYDPATNKATYIFVY